MTAGAGCHIRRGVSHYCIGEAQNVGPPLRKHTLDDPEADYELEETGREGGEFIATKAVVETVGPRSPTTGTTRANKQLSRTWFRIHAVT